MIFHPTFSHVRAQHVSALMHSNENGSFGKNALTKMILLTSFSLTSPVMQIFFHHPLAALYNVVVLLFNLIVFLLTANH